jgi:hypothetical protein
MRQSGLKRSLLSIVPGGYETVDAQTGHTPFKRLLGGATKEADSSKTNQQSEDLGIRRVTRPVTSTVQPRVPIRKRSQILTIREVLGLNRATVRESSEHRPWPRETVLKFMAADVVTRK